MHLSGFLHGGTAGNPRNRMTPGGKRSLIIWIIFIVILLSIRAFSQTYDLESVKGTAYQREYAVRGYLQICEDDSLITISLENSFQFYRITSMFRARGHKAYSIDTPADWSFVIVRREDIVILHKYGEEEVITKFEY